QRSGRRADLPPRRRAARPPAVSGLEHVLVLGAGQMGSGIAQVVAASGRRVFLLDPAPGAVEQAFETMRRSLTKLGADPDETLTRVTPVGELVAADLMIEAVSEDQTVKEDVF